MHGGPPAQRQQPPPPQQEMPKPSRSDEELSAFKKLVSRNSCDDVFSRKKIKGKEYFDNYFLQQLAQVSGGQVVPATNGPIPQKQTPLPQQPQASMQQPMTLMQVQRISRISFGEF